MCVSACACMCVCVYMFNMCFCGFVQIALWGCHCRLSKEYLASRDGDIMLPLQCTLHMLSDGKGQKSLPCVFLPTGKGGCRGSVCGGHSLRLPEGPRGKRVSPTHTCTEDREHTFYLKCTHTHTHTLPLHVGHADTHSVVC